MTALRARVMRLQAAAWRLRRAGPAPCGLPFALVLMTDERRQPDIVSLLQGLPPAGAMPPVLVIFRHYGLAPGERAALAARARTAAAGQGHVFSVAGERLAGADGAHNAGRAAAGLSSISVHSLAEAAAKRAQAADLALISPVFATKSHPCAQGLGPARAQSLARRLSCPAFALGGITPQKAQGLEGTVFQGIAVIGAWSDGD